MDLLELKKILNIEAPGAKFKEYINLSLSLSLSLLHD